MGEDVMVGVEVGVPVGVTVLGVEVAGDLVVAGSSGGWIGRVS